MREGGGRYVGPLTLSPWHAAGAAAATGRGGCLMLVPGFGQCCALWRGVQPLPGNLYCSPHSPHRGGKPQAQEPGAGQGRLLAQVPGASLPCGSVESASNRDCPVGDCVSRCHVQCRLELGTSAPSSCCCARGVGSPTPIPPSLTPHKYHIPTPQCCLG